MHYVLISTCGIAYFSSPLAVTYTQHQLVSSRTEIRTRFSGLSGVYLWTNVQTGSQYVGSSNNLGLRLIDYFSVSYIHDQVDRGSIISRAILKYGLASFTLQVIVTGVSYPRDTPISLRSYIRIEQYYLDTYDCAYNVNLIASPVSYTVPTSTPNKGAANASYGLIGANSFAWNRSHSPEDLASFSATRGTTPLFVYSLTTLLLLFSFTSGKAFSIWANGSARFGADTYFHVLASPGQAVQLGTNYIVTVTLITPDMLAQLRATLPVVNMPVARAHKPGAMTVYGMNVLTGELEVWPSQEACTRALVGRSFVNKSTIRIRIDKGILYKGYLLSNTPFK